MKFFNFFSNVIPFVLLVLLLIFPAGNNFSQSGQVKENLPEPQSIQINEAKENKKDISKLETYEYVEPAPIKIFIDKLNEFGAKGYRFKDVTQIPYTNEGDDINAVKTNFAGIVKLDEAKYEYRIINIEEVADLAAELNRESKEGFNFREIITYQSTMSFKSEGKNDPISKGLETLYSSAFTYNLLLLERETGKETAAPREFQLLKAGYGLGKNPSKTMQALVDEAAKQNMLPVAGFMSRGFAVTEPNQSKWKLVDNYYGVIIEKSAEKSDTRIQFVRAALQKSFEKRVNKFASAGFRMADTRLTQGFMYKNRENPQSPVTYKWLNGSSKSLPDELAKLSDKNAKFFGTGISRGFWVSTVLTESLLIFEQPTGTAKELYEYVSLKMIDAGPQSGLIAKSSIPPDSAIRKFRRLVKEGYNFIKLFYADEKVAALFERQTPK